MSNKTTVSRERNSDTARAVAINRKRHLTKSPFCNVCKAQHGIELDHIIPLVLSGTSFITNCQVICDVCHRDKTEQETKAIRAMKELGLIYTDKKETTYYITKEEMLKIFYELKTLVQKGRTARETHYGSN